MPYPRKISSLSPPSRRNRGSPTNQANKARLTIETPDFAPHAPKVSSSIFLTEYDEERPKRISGAPSPPSPIDSRLESRPISPLKRRLDSGEGSPSKKAKSKSASDNSQNTRSDRVVTNELFPYGSLAHRPKSSQAASRVGKLYKDRIKDDSVQLHLDPWLVLTPESVISENKISPVAQALTETTKSEPTDAEKSLALVAINYSSTQFDRLVRGILAACLPNKQSAHTPERQNLPSSVRFFVLLSFLSSSCLTVKGSPTSDCKAAVNYVRPPLANDRRETFAALTNRTSYQRFSNDLALTVKQYLISYFDKLFTFQVCALQRVALPMYGPFLKIGSDDNGFTEDEGLIVGAYNEEILVENNQAVWTELIKCGSRMEASLDEVLELYEKLTIL